MTVSLSNSDTDADSLLFTVMLSVFNSGCSF